MTICQAILRASHISNFQQTFVPPVSPVPHVPIAITLCEALITPLIQLQLPLKTLNSSTHTLITSPKLFV